MLQIGLHTSDSDLFVWRLGEEEACGEFGCMVGDEVEEG